VLAWNRSTDFTTDRAATLATLEQFKKDHEQVEADLVQYFSSLRARYSNGEIPPEIQVEIDAIFRRPGGAAARPVPSPPVTDSRRMADDARRAADRVKFAVVGGRHVASIQTAIFCGDDKQSIVGEDWGTVDLNLSEATYRRFLAEGVTYTKRVRVKSDPKFVKVIAYDYASDLTGSALVTIALK